MSILDHLWQSSLVAILAYGLTLLLRKNSAAVRHGIWFAASVKFLLPFSLLAALGNMAFVHTVPAKSIAVLTEMRPVAMPFSVVVPPPAVHSPSWLGVLLAIWLLGLVAIMTVWLVQWSRLRAVVRSARALESGLAVPVKTTPRLMEPGLVGIWRPVILLPDSIVTRLSTVEIDAILNHELCHLRRRDNLLAAIHMLVEAVFWFHPLVWFIGARLGEERERACDEAVLARGKNPLEYAQAILKVCQLYLRSPLPCASGISGADLDQRISAIMSKDRIEEMDAGRKLLLAALLALTVATPFVTGGLKSAPAARLAESLATALLPLAPATPIIAAAPAARTAPQTRDIIRPRPRVAPAPAIAAPEIALSPPALEISPVLAAIPVPKLDTGSQPAAEERAVCRPPQQIPGSRLKGPQVCLPQREWDGIRKADLVLMPDGRTLVASYASNVTRNAPAACASAPTSASNPINIAASIGCF